MFENSKSLKYGALDAEYADVELDRDVAVDDYKDMELELVKTTRDNFRVWKDYEF